MNKENFKFYFWGVPFISGFAGLMVSSINESQLPGVSFILGVICGYLGLITWVLWIKNDNREVKSEEE